MKDEDLERLNAVLLSLPVENEGMLLSEFNGLCAGLITGPDMIAPSEWLPLVWGDDVSPVFSSPEEAQSTTAMIMAHYNVVAQSLTPPVIDYAPVFDVDTRTDETLWESWAMGFERAMRLRMDAWTRIVESGDEEAASSVTMMLALYEIASGDSDLPKDSKEELTKKAPDLITQMVMTLNDWTKSHPTEAMPLFRGVANAEYAPARSNKIGRNEPCPCGSGRKYKKCCGAN